MTSVVDTSVKHFTSAMVGAPVLNGVAGSLISVLDSVLVNGFDTKTATSLVVADGVATLSFGGTHSATVDSVILVAGSSISALNGEQKVTVSTAGEVKFNTAASDGTATGTITFKMAPLGWTKVYSGTNKAVYRSSDVMSYGHYLRVDDTSTTAARVVGYESMSDVDTGVAPFPTAAQVSGGGYWGKANVANTNPVGWTVFGDSRVFYIHMSAYQANNGISSAYASGSVWGFGDMIALRPGGDSFAAALASGGSSWTSNTQHGTFDNSTTPMYSPRDYTGLGSSVAVASHAYISSNSTNISGMDTTLGAFPSVVDGSLRMSRRYGKLSGRQEPRFDIPGLYTIPMTGVATSFAHWDKVVGGGDLTGRILMGVSVGNGNSAPSTSYGMTLVDITGPWR